MPVFDVTGDVDRKAIAVRFANGILKPEDHERISFKCYSKTENVSKSSTVSKHVITASIDGITYLGKTYGQTNRFPADHCDYYLGVHNKVTGKIQVVSAELCQLEPSIEDSRYLDQLNSNSQNTFKEKSDALARDFGSGRSQRAVNKRLNNKLDDEVISQATVALAENKHTQQQTAESTEPVTTESSSLPPHNKDAATPDDVYKLKDLISPEILEKISSRAQIFFNCTPEEVIQWRAEQKYSSFVLGKLSSLSLREDAKKLQSQCLMYLQCLMDVFLMKAKDFNRKYPLPSDWPVEIKNHILNTFTLEVTNVNKKNSRCIPGRLKDLLLSHILVLCLKLNQFDLILNTLVADLKLSQRRITTHAVSLGCTIKKIKDPAGGQEMLRAVLTVPFKLPEIRGKLAKNRIF